MNEQLQLTLNSPYLRIGTAIVLAIAFVVLPWLAIGQLTGLQLGLNYVSSPGDGLFLWLIPLAAIGLAASVKFIQLRWSIFLSVIALAWYVYHVATSAFASNLFGLIGIGFWVAVVATLIGIWAVLSRRRA